MTRVSQHKITHFSNLIWLFHSAGSMLEPEYAEIPKPDHCSVDLLKVAERILKAAPQELNLSVDDTQLACRPSKGK